MTNQNFRGDFTVEQTFWRDGTQIAVPDHVIVEYFTAQRKGKFVVERHKDLCRYCSVSDDGMTLISRVALSRKEIGTGRLLRNVIEVTDDASFPDGVRYVPCPEALDINLYTGKSDNTDAISDTVTLSAMQYGWSAYELAVQHGFDGTEEEWLESIKTDAASLAKEYVDSAVATSQQTLQEALASKADLDNSGQSITAGTIKVGTMTWDSKGLRDESGIGFGSDGNFELAGKFSTHGNIQTYGNITAENGIVTTAGLTLDGLALNNVPFKESIRSVIIEEDDNGDYVTREYTAALPAKSGTLALSEDVDEAVSALQEGVDTNKAAAQAAQDDVDALKDDALIDVWDVVDERDLVLRTKEWHVNPDTMQWEALTDYTGQSVMVFRLRGAVRLRVSTLYQQCVLCKGFGTKGDAPLGDPLDGAAFTASQSILGYVDCEEYSYLVTGINGTSKSGERVYGSINGSVTNLGIYLNIKETRLDYYYREAGRDNMEAAQYLARRMADGADFHVNPLTEASDGGGVTASGICGTRARNVSYIEDNVQVCCNPRLETLQVRKLTGGPRFDTNFSLKDVRIIDMSGVTSLFNTFNSCQSLETVNASEWDTGKVTSMYCTFYYCESLKSLDVSGWDVSNVTSIYSMFRFCPSLASLDVSGWNTSNVKNMGMTFQGCESLKSLDVSGWNTSNVVNMLQMFYRSGIQSLDVSGWDTSNVADMAYMFFGCGSLESITFGTWDMGAVTAGSNMFTMCNRLTTITGTMRNIKVDLSFNQSSLTKESALVVINGLYDFAADGDTSTHTVSFSSATKALLTDDDKAAATAKGWTIA